MEALPRAGREGGNPSRTRGAFEQPPGGQSLKQKVLQRYREVYQGLGRLWRRRSWQRRTSWHPSAVRRCGCGCWRQGCGSVIVADGPYRKWREPKHHFGELVQLDGSHHPWFGEEHNSCCLMNLVDDATGITLAMMSEQETTEAAMRILWAWIEAYGIPLALYCDMKNVYLSDREPTVEEQLEGKLPMTAFGLACEKLGIRIISAHSPQAKGRVERKHGVYQDRFVKELRLRGAKTIAEANMILKGGFIEKLNKKFAHQPAGSGGPSRSTPCASRTFGTSSALSKRAASARTGWFETRIDSTNYSAAKRPLPRATSKVTVRTWLDGSLHILHRGRRIRLQGVRSSNEGSTQGHLRGHFYFAEYGDISTLR